MKTTFKYEKKSGQFAGQLVNRMGKLLGVKLNKSGNPMMLVEIPGIDYPKQFNVDEVQDLALQTPNGMRAIDSEKLSESICELDHNELVENILDIL
jgi:hypothetical protein